MGVIERCREGEESCRQDATQPSDQHGLPVLRHLMQ